MIVVRRRHPAIPHEPARAKQVLRAEDDDLQPLPEHERREAVVVHGREEDVVRVSVKVRERQEPQSGLAEDKVPFESAAAVALDVAGDLGQPEGEVEEGEEGEVASLNDGGPAEGVDGDEDYAEEDEEEAGVVVAECGDARVSDGFDESVVLFFG